MHTQFRYENILKNRQHRKLKRAWEDKTEMDLEDMNIWQDPVVCTHFMSSDVYLPDVALMNAGVDVALAAPSPLPSAHTGPQSDYIHIAASHAAATNCCRQKHESLCFTNSNAHWSSEPTPVFTPLLSYFQDMNLLSRSML